MPRPVNNRGWFHGMVDWRSNSRRTMNNAFVDVEHVDRQAAFNKEETRGANWPALNRP